MNIKKIARGAAGWLGRRLRVRSTYIVAAAIAAAVGVPSAAPILRQAGDLVAVAIDGGLIEPAPAADADPALHD
jgi:hypothetical protein